NHGPLYRASVEQNRRGRYGARPCDSGSWQGDETQESALLTCAICAVDLRGIFFGRGFVDLEPALFAYSLLFLPGSKRDKENNWEGQALVATQAVPFGLRPAQ